MSSPAPALIPVASALLASPPPMAVYLGKRMPEICVRSISTKKDARGNPENQCAHFVSHVMGFDGEITCRNSSDADKKVAGMGAILRVNQLFKRCPEVGYWEKRSLGLSSLLIFVTRSSNMGHDCVRLDMGEHPRKHVGIFVDGKVWHHGANKVEADTESSFIAKFKFHYGRELVGGDTVNFYYGKFPA